MAFTTTEMIIVLAALFLAFQGQEVRSAAIGDIARNVQSDLILLDAGLNPQSRTSKRINFDVPAGGAVDMFYRYGFFSLSVRVVPREDAGSWLIREPTADVFDQQSLVRTEVAGPDTFAQQPIQISLAEDLQELMQAYFRDFKADGVEESHKLFTGSWRLPTAAEYFGLSAKSLDGSENSYVLVKLVRNKGTVATAGNMRLAPEPSIAANEVKVGDSEAILKFVKNFGTHYFKSVTVGEAVYQVFVLSKEQMQSLKATLRGQTSVGLREWSAIYDSFLAPWLVKETGEPRAASGDLELQRFLDQQLRVSGQFGSYPNIVEGLVKNPANAQRLEELTSTTSAVIGLEFASLKDFFPSIQVREFYDETFAAQSALWGSNL